MRFIVKTAGFTLIEVAILLVIIGLTVSGAISVVGPVRAAGKDNQTSLRMDLIQKALQVYVIRNGCLPCPANGGLDPATASAGRSNDGTFYVTACAAGACATANAVVPWRTLGLSDNEALDAWGNRIRYVASPALALVTGMVRTSASSFPTGSIRVEATSSGNVRVSDGTVDGADDTVTTEITGAIFGQMAYVLVSSGPDRALAIPATGCAAGCPVNDAFAQLATTRRQRLNTNGGATAFALIEPPITASGAGHFDDVVRFITGPQMIFACGANACGNPF